MLSVRGNSSKCGFSCRVQYTRESIICAPSCLVRQMLPAISRSHLRYVGLIGSSRYDKDMVSSGKKIVYIAPMKALAQEVVEKFSSKLKKCDHCKRIDG